MSEQTESMIPKSLFLRNLSRDPSNHVKRKLRPGNSLGFLLDDGVRIRRRGVRPTELDIKKCAEHADMLADGIRDGYIEITDPTGRVIPEEAMRSLKSYFGHELERQGDHDTDAKKHLEEVYADMLKTKEYPSLHLEEMSKVLSGFSSELPWVQEFKSKVDGHLSDRAVEEAKLAAEAAKAAEARLAAEQAAAKAEEMTQVKPEEPETFSVVLVSAGSSKDKVKMAREVRNSTGLDLKSVQIMLESLPKVLKEGLSKEDAEGLKTVLEKAGGKVEVQSSKKE